MLEIDVTNGGHVVCAGIYMWDPPSLPYSILWGERQIVSVANLTGKDRIDFLKGANRTHIMIFPLKEANMAQGRLRDGKLVGAAVMKP